MFLELQALQRPRARGALGGPFDALLDVLPGLVTTGVGIYGQVTAAQQAADRAKQQAQAMQAQIQATLAAQAAAQQARADAAAAAMRPPAASGIGNIGLIALAVVAVAAALFFGGKR